MIKILKQYASVKNINLKQLAVNFIFDILQNLNILIFCAIG